MANINKGFVELVASEATDLSVVNAARVSFGKKVETVETADEKLIHFLMKNRHGTPFEHNFFNFHVKCPIFVAREWFRHRIGSFNEISMRYTTPEIEYFLPAIEDVRTQQGKPGHYIFVSVKDSGYSPEEMDKIDQWLYAVQLHQEEATRLYNWGLELGIAREQARIVFPVSIYTEFYWSVNARSLMNFLSLRNAPQAMKEIRDYAVELETLFKQTMPITHAAFVSCERIAA